MHCSELATYHGGTGGSPLVLPPGEEPGSGKPASAGVRLGVGTIYQTPEPERWNTVVTDSLAWAVGELARMATKDFQVDELLRRLCEVSARSLTADGVGVMSAEGDRTRFVHASADGFGDLGMLQEVTQVGPCRDAMDSKTVMAAATMAEMRWPEFERAATEIDVRAVLSVPLISRNRSWGSLDLYWCREHLATEDDRASAQLLADVAVSYLVMAADRAEASAAQEQLARRVLHDQLTGLPNRGLMQELIYHALGSSERRGTSVAVLFVDLDFFKGINDTFGHQAGDVVLQTVADRMVGVVRAGDTVGRLSGDEFLVLCEDIGSDADVLLNQLGERIRSAVSEPIHLDQAELILSASIGIAVTGEQPSAAELIHLADEAMYRAKAAGRNRVAVHRHVPQVAAEQRSLERRLFRAVDRDELRLHFQPIVSPAGRIVAVEALVRWQHPELGLLTAAQFVEVAESTGAIVAIGRWVIRMASAQLRDWQLLLGADAPEIVFCNVSPRELASADLPDVLASSLARHGLRPGALGLEVLEANLADPRMISVLTRLQRSGHPLAVDDYGGYSSLSRLIDLPVAFVKVDRSLVARLPDDARSRAIVKAVVALAGDVDLRVISEGIETGPQAEYLRSAGSHLLQGYFFGRPTTAADLTAVLTGSRRLRLLGERAAQSTSAPTSGPTAPVGTTGLARGISPQRVPLDSPAPASGAALS